jgi:hypothetical protein
MSKQGIVTTGVVAFSNLTEFDTYNGKSTGAYSLVITMEPNEAAKLEDMGVKVRDYKGTSQRKFRSQYHVPVVDLDNHPVAGEIPYGSTVRVLWVAGDMDPEHGLRTHMNKVRLVEVAESSVEDPEEF